MIKTIPGCTELCPLEDFFAIVKDIIPSDDEYYCRPTENMSNSSKKVYSSGSSLAVGETWYYLLSIFLFIISTVYSDIYR